LLSLSFLVFAEVFVGYIYQEYIALIVYEIWYVSPPFSQFFLHCGACIDRAGQHDRPVSRALMSLLNDIWSPLWYLHSVAILLQ